jgi:hypothetical protein
VLVIQNETIVDYLRSSYRKDDVDPLLTFLNRHGTFRFSRSVKGFFPAASLAVDDEASGYQNAWVRDNVHIAHAHFVWGDRAVVSGTAKALMCFFQGQRFRMQRIIKSPALAADPMNRPHVRFNARNGQEIPQKWPHAQNDALGYFLWFFSKMAIEKLVNIEDAELQTLTDLTLYLRAIKYWKDPDSGHWEEARKICASSIGTVVAGLREFSRLCTLRSLYSLPALKTRNLDDILLTDMVSMGEKALNRILPHESKGPGNALKRRYDAALLFLIYPLEVVSSEMASQVLNEVTTALSGQMGIRRYLGDSYWCPDYRTVFPPGERSGDFSEKIEMRDAHIKAGQEAQWCIFDPIISCIHGVSIAKQQGSDQNRLLQSLYLNRSLGQLTEEKNGVMAFQCPEAYFLENGFYVPNDHVPLQWTQANLRMALHWMEATAEP